jgi:hypothetical protein
MRHVARDYRESRGPPYRHCPCNVRRTEATKAMSDKVIVTGIAVINDPDPWEVGMVTERLPVVDLYDDGIEPDDSIFDIKRDRAA